MACKICSPLQSETLLFCSFDMATYVNVTFASHLRIFELLLFFSSSNI